MLCLIWLCKWCFCNSRAHRHINLLGGKQAERRALSPGGKNSSAGFRIPRAGAGSSGWGRRLGLACLHSLHRIHMRSPKRADSVCFTPKQTTYKLFVSLAEIYQGWEEHTVFTAAFASEHLWSEAEVAATSILLTNAPWVTSGRWNFLCQVDISPTY